MIKTNKNNFIKCLYAKVLLCFFIFCCLTSCLYNSAIIKVNYLSSKNSDYVASFCLKDFFSNLFKKNNQEEVKEMPSVYVGGIPLGFTLECDGVIVIAVGQVHTTNGVVSTIKEGSINNGDIVLKINNISITSAQTISDEMDKQANNNSIVELLIKRGNSSFIAKILPAKDVITGQYKLGLWIRDNSAGVGTLSYIREDNLRFGALGHSVCDVDTSTMLPLSTGNIYKCNIIGVNPSIKGTAGELKGLFLRGGTMLGTLDKNNDYGVFGTANQDLVDLCKRKIKVASKSQVKTGKAVILCTVDGSEAKEYDIEIIKTTRQTKLSNKSMVIRVTDDELISKTGGIVQGMSGSPIIQNNMLVGSVTHVFVSDPTKGYGIYAEWMIDN